MHPSRARSWMSLWPQASAGWDRRRAAVMDRVDNLAGIDALEVDRGNPQVGMPELSLDDRQRDSFVPHSMAWACRMVRRGTSPHSSLGSEPSKLTSRGGRRPAVTAGRAGKDAEQQAQRQLHAMLGPGRRIGRVAQALVLRRAPRPVPRRRRW